MQYVEYEWAKKNKVVGLTIYEWIKLRPNLSLKTRGQVINDWRRGTVLLNIGEKPLVTSANQKSQDTWIKNQINPDFHQKQYLQKYLEGVWKL